MTYIGRSVVILGCAIAAVLAVAALNRPAAPESASPAEHRVDINRDGVAELSTLPDIGVRKSEAILRYREVHGPFLSVDDLARVPGIGPRTVEKIRSRVVPLPGSEASR